MPPTRPQESQMVHPVQFHAPHFVPLPVVSPHFHTNPGVGPQVAQNRLRPAVDSRPLRPVHLRQRFLLF